MSTRDKPNRTRLLASGLLVLTFVVGALAGAATDRALSSAETQVEQRRPATSRDPGRSTRRQPSIFYGEGVFDSLAATAQQRQAIEAILARRDREANALFAQIKPSLDAMRKQTWGEMKAQLTAEQLTKLEQIIAERRERWQKDRQHNQDNNPRP
jgi:Spy/CpxP family protein refolding chaperone